MRRGARVRYEENATPSIEEGNALVIGLVLVIVMAGLAAAFMQASVRGGAESVAAGSRTRVLYIAEAGVNDAILDIRKGGTGNLGTRDSPVVFGGGVYYVKAVDNGDDTFTITSNGVLSGQRRAIQVVIAPKGEVIFTRGLFGDQDLYADGSVVTDSYESDLGSYASQAVNVHPVTGLTYARANGTLGSNGNLDISGSVKVLGDAIPGPSGSVTISGAGVYIDGSTAPAADPSVLPPLTYSPPIPTAGALNTNKDMTFTAGTYRYSSLKAQAKAKLEFEGDVVLYIDGDVDITGQAEFVVAPGATLTIYHGGSDFHLGGGGLVNQTQVPRNFRLYSTGDTVTLRGNSEFHGAVYAPNAVIDARGTSDMYGSLVGKQVLIGGNAAFHYDEALAKSPDSRSTLRLVSWRRVAPEGN